MAASDRSISETFLRQRRRLRAFIRKRVADMADAEDILQDVFAEWVEAARMATPIEQTGAWLFRVARNRITDLIRKKKSTHPAVYATPDEDEPSLEDLLPALDGGPEAVYARRLLLDELEAALDELPAEQREAFLAHELGGTSFKELALRTGVGVNTLLARKRYAVLRLRRRLQEIYEEFVEP